MKNFRFFKTASFNKQRGEVFKCHTCTEPCDILSIVHKGSTLEETSRTTDGEIYAGEAVEFWLES